MCACPRGGGLTLGLLSHLAGAEDGCENLYRAVPHSFDSATGALTRYLGTNQASDRGQRFKRHNPGTATTQGSQASGICKRTFLGSAEFRRPHSSYREVCGQLCETRQETWPYAEQLEVEVRQRILIRSYCFKGRERPR
jgi:hypothetical protein